MVKRRTGTPLTQVRFPVAARNFSLRVNCQCRLSHGVRTPSSAMACIIHICAHVKDPVVHVRVRWIREALKHLASTVAWVARLCRSWLSPGKTTRISHRRNPNETMQLYTSTTTTKTRKKRPITYHRSFASIACETVLVSV